MYYPEIKLSACHKNKKKIQKCTDFCDHAFEKIGSPLKVKKLF